MARRPDGPGNLAFEAQHSNEGVAVVGDQHGSKLRREGGKSLRVDFEERKVRPAHGEDTEPEPPRSNASAKTRATEGAPNRRMASRPCEKVA